MDVKLSNSVKDIRDFFSKQISGEEAEESANWTEIVRHKRRYGLSEAKPKGPSIYIYRKRSVNNNETIKRTQSELNEPSAGVKKKTNRAANLKQLIYNREGRQCATNTTK